MFSLRYEIVLQRWKNRLSSNNDELSAQLSSHNCRIWTAKTWLWEFLRGGNSTKALLPFVITHPVKLIPIDFMHLAFTAPSRRFHTHNKHLIIVKHVPDKRVVSCSTQSCLFKPSGWCRAALPTYAGSTLPTVEQKPRAKKEDRECLLWGSVAASCFCLYQPGSEQHWHTDRQWTCLIRDQPSLW